MRLSRLLPAVVLPFSMAFDDFLPTLPPLARAFQFPSSSRGSSEASNTPPMSQTPQIEPLPSQRKETTSQATQSLQEIDSQRLRDGRPLSPKQRVSRRFSHAPPRVCLAFLSCCGRTDLLERTLLAAIAHMETDEPMVPYEVAWVDNGSPGVVALASQLGVDALLTPTGEIAKESTASNVKGHRESGIEQPSAPMVDHVWLSEENLGLAWGLNTLFFDMCTAPFVLTLEEDWMYMDHTVAIQTPARRNAVALALEVASSNMRSFDGRAVHGVFLRPETYDSFLKPPHVGPWQQLPSSHSTSSSSLASSVSTTLSAAVEYRVYCADVSGDSSYLWGSYTNGAALYNRSSLYHTVGRFFGEPGDGFHESYTEANYAYRAAAKHCHALLRLEPECPNAFNGCNAAFSHVGGGRSTRPSAIRHLKAPDPSWAVYGTPAYAATKRANQEAAQEATKRKGALRPSAGPTDGSRQENYLAPSEVATLDQSGSTTSSNNPAASWAETRAAYADYQAQVASANAAVFAREAAARGVLRAQAQLLRKLAAELVAAANDDETKSSSDSEHNNMLAEADSLDAWADSPHPLPGFWDGMGKPIEDEPSTQASNALNGERMSADSQNTAKTAPSASTAIVARAAELKAQANLLRRIGPAEAKKQVPSWHELSDDAVMAVADAAERLAADPSALALILHAELERLHMQQSLSPKKSVPPPAKSSPSNVKTAPKRLPVVDSQRKSRENPETPQAASRPTQKSSQTKEHKKNKNSEPDKLRARRQGDAQQQQQQQQPAQSKEAVAWAQAAHDYERSGKRAFTGIGYQEQYHRVQELLRASGSSNKPTQKSPWQVLMKAVYGPSVRL